MTTEQTPHVDIFQGFELDPFRSPVRWEPTTPIARSPGTFVLGDLGGGKGLQSKHPERPT